MVTPLALLLLLGAPPSPVPTAGLPKGTDKLVDSVSIGGPHEDSVKVVRAVLAEAGHEAGDEDAYGSMYTEWKLAEVRTEPPKEARRSRFFVTIDEDSCFVQLLVEEARQRDEGHGRFPWGDWNKAYYTTIEERKLFVSVMEQLKKRLPVPDPNAPPPGMETAQAPRPWPAGLTEPVDLTALGRTAPAALFQPQPPSPSIAKNAALSGTVVARITVDRQGTVTDVTIVKSQPPFDESVTTTLRKWRYQPLMVDGKPMAFTIEVSKTFGGR